MAAPASLLAEKRRQQAEIAGRVISTDSTLTIRQIEEFARRHQTGCRLPTAEAAGIRVSGSGIVEAGRAS